MTNTPLDPTAIPLAGWGTGYARTQVSLGAADAVAASTPSIPTPAAHTATPPSKGRMRPAGAILGIDVGEAETQAFWTDLLRDLVKRGLAGVELAISDAHAGIQSAIAKVLGCAWQRCTVHVLRDCVIDARITSPGGPTR